MTKTQFMFDQIRIRRAVELGKTAPLTIEEIADAIGIDRKTLRLKLKSPYSFRGSELSGLYQYLNFTDTERDEFNREVTK